jgi:hypothetical protein
VYYTEIKHKTSLIKLKVDSPVLSKFPSQTSFFFELYNFELFEYADTILPIPVPYGSETFNVQRRRGTIVRLDVNGRLAYHTPDRAVRHENALYLCFSVFVKHAISFPGKPRTAGIIRAPTADLFPVCRNVFLIETKTQKYELVAIDSKTAFVAQQSSYRDISQFAEIFRSPDATIRCRDQPERQLYYTRTGRLILPEIDAEQCFSFNFLVGDIVHTPSDVKATFVGCTDGVVWIQPGQSRCVFSVLDTHTLVCEARPGNDICNVVIVSEPAVLDRTPTFCEKFGRSVSDLVWVPRRGIVEMVGLSSGRFVFLDFCDNSLFSSDPYHFLLIRAKDKKLPHTRKIMTTEGEMVVLNVCGQKSVFQPGDRVVGEFGGGTFLGSDPNGRSFVQSD